MKIQKNGGGGSGWGGDVNEELSFLRKFFKKIGGGSVRIGGASGWM